MDILVHAPKGEMTIEYWSEMEYKRVVLIMKLIEDTFNVDLNNYPEIRSNILSTSNFIRRLPSMISEVV